jgi:hypothetical protein
MRYAIRRSFLLVVGIVPTVFSGAEKLPEQPYEVKEVRPVALEKSRNLTGKSSQDCIGPQDLVAA